MEHGVPGTRHPGVGRGRQAGGRRAAAIPVAAGLGAHQPNRRLRLAAEPQTGRREVSALTDARKTLAYDFFRILRAPLVEEENSFITGRVGQRVRLRDPFMNGRPVLIEAMQIYKELERQKAIKLPRKESGKYILHQSIFDSEHDKKGDEFFNINWSEITTEHVLTLLCCFATEYNNVVSADYIRTMTDTVTKQDNEYSPYEPFVNMIKAFYRMELTKVPQGKLTGKDNIF